MLDGQIVTKILKTNEGIVKLCKDSVMGSYSIGLRTKNDMEWKFISKELHDLLVSELPEQEGNKWG